MVGVEGAVRIKHVNLRGDTIQSIKSFILVFFFFFFHVTIKLKHLF